ncbi:Uncharacterised protein [uncultured archaeon]|nr:Uncharacterised protein [uncultured archaeon]
MNFSSWVIKLHKKKIVSDKPDPIIPFLLVLVFILSGFLIEDAFFRYFAFFLGLFTLIFAIIHLIVVLVIQKKSKRTSK